jgi:tetratricopeptide (TPR) repeat protein
MLMSGPLRSLGRPQDATAALRRGLEIAQKHLELNPDDTRALYLGAGALMQIGDRETALEWANRAYSTNESDSMVSYNVACVYALGGMIEEALSLLEKAIQNGFGHREWLENDSDLNALRAESRFQTLLGRL